MVKLKKLVIKESEWGTGSEGGKLLRRVSAKKCCLGFACEQFGGLSESQIRGRGFPRDVVGAAGVLPKWMLAYGKPTTVSRLATANDSTRTSHAARKRRIKSLFKHVGVVVTFVK